MLGTLLLSLLYLVVVVGSGFLVTMWIFERDRKYHAEYWLPVSFGLGLGFQCSTYLLSMFLFNYASVALWVVLNLSFCVLNAFLYRRLVPLKSYTGLDIIKPVDNPRLKTLYFLGVGLLLAFFVTLFYNAMDYPMASYDGRAIWNYKAKIIYHEKTVYTEAFLDPHRVHYHPDYPLLVPLSEFGYYSFIGKVDEDNVRFLFSSFMVFFALYIYGMIRRWGSKWVALFVTLVFAGAPFREFWVVKDGGAINSGESDFPLAFFACIAITSFWIWWTSRRRSVLILGALFTGFCLMIKKEGMVIFTMMMSVNIVALLAAREKTRLKRLIPLAGALAGAIVVALPWILVGPSLKNIYDEDYFANMTVETLSYAPSRLPVIWAIFENDVTSIDQWNYTWLVYAAILPILLIVGFKTRWAFGLQRRWHYFNAVVFIWLTGYIIVYLLSPLNLIFHLNTSLRRLLAHIYPIVLLELGFVIAFLSRYFRLNHR